MISKEDREVLSHYHLRYTTLTLIYFFLVPHIVLFLSRGIVYEADYGYAFIISIFMSPAYFMILYKYDYQDRKRELFLTRK